MVMNYMSHSYLPNKQSSVYIFGILSVSYLVKFVIHRHPLWDPCHLIFSLMISVTVFKLSVHNIWWWLENMILEMLLSVNFNTLLLIHCKTMMVWYYPVWKLSHILKCEGRGGAFGRATVQAGRAWVQFPMLPLEFVIDTILPATLWPRDQVIL